MKVQRELPEPAFKPIVIVLDTKEEVERLILMCKAVYVPTSISADVANFAAELRNNIRNALK